METPRQVAARWRTDAEVFRRYGDERLAGILEQHARELEESLAATADEALTLEEAARESGYSAEHIRRLVATGRLPNAGRKGAPRVRRADLPHRATPATGYSAQADAAAALARINARKAS